MTEIRDSAGRIAELINDVKAYSHMDQNPSLEEIVGFLWAGYCTIRFDAVRSLDLDFGLPALFLLVAYHGQPETADYHAKLRAARDAVAGELGVGLIGGSFALALKRAGEISTGERTR